MTDYSKLAQLRPGMPVSALADIIGPSFVKPDPRFKGYFHSADIENFGARITAENRLGSISFYSAFPSDAPVVGLRMGMSLIETLAVFPALKASDDTEGRSAIKHGISIYRCTGSDSTQLELRFDARGLISIVLQAHGATYPVPPNRNATDRIKHAYNLEMLHRSADRSAEQNHGWVFGLPPGIKPQQWPLDPITGYPLMHGFTLLLPEDYRCHGPGIVAFSFFATASDQNDGGARVREDLRNAVLGTGSKPSDPGLAVFWQHAQSSHSRLHRMRDILDYEYAVILLTQGEFDGPLCQPPRIIPNENLAAIAPPKWLSVGSAAEFWQSSGASAGSLPIIDYFSYRLLGAVPDGTLEWNRAILCTPREEDPNAGIAPEENYGGGPSSSGYTMPFYFEGEEEGAETYRERDWVKLHKPNHIGGTMRPAQAIPPFSPFYIGFEEYFGGYNFGTGNAQLDFLEMKIDWAC